MIAFYNVFIRTIVYACAWLQKNLLANYTEMRTKRELWSTWHMINNTQCSGVIDFSPGGNYHSTTVN